MADKLATNVGKKELELIFKDSSNMHWCTGRKSKATD